MINFLVSVLGGMIAAGAIVFGFVHHAPQAPTTPAPQVLGSTAPVGGGTYRLQSSVGTSNTTITLSSFKEPVSNIKYTMTYLGATIEYGTLDPQTSKSEFVSFSGITQNSDGTATLTGVSRGLTRAPAGSDCTASTTLAQAHASQSIFIISDSPCLFAQYPAKANNETITGQWTFSTFPITPSNATSSETVSGIVQLATGAQAAAGTSAGSTGGRLVLPASLATSTYNSGSASNVVPITGSLGTLDSNFIASTTLVSSTTVLTTVGTSTWSVPSNVRYVTVESCGAGAAGGSVTSGHNSSGGGAGGYSRSFIDLTGTTSVQYVIGKAGASTTPLNGSWTEFGPSTASFFIKDNGGATGADNSAAGGLGGTASGGNMLNIQGQPGSGISTTSAGLTNTGNGPGGSSFLGKGGVATYTNGSNSGAQTATGYCSGGAGGASVSNSMAPGDGSQGIIIISWTQLI